MNGQSRRLCVFFSLLMLAACEAASPIVARQVVVEWPEQQLVFVADIRVGRVQSFRMGGGALLAQTVGMPRAQVRDIRLEPTRNKLWVLRSNAVQLYDARALALQQQFPLAALKVSALRIEDGRVLLLDKGGASIGQIDSETRVASWNVRPNS